MKYHLYKLRNKILEATNTLPFLNSYYSGMATIFMLHRVHPFDASKLPPNENMKISPEFLETLIIELKAKGFEIISLDRLHALLQGNQIVEKKIVFTLDDGYKDNFDIAYPIFKKHNVPFTIYLTTSMPENEAFLWWYILEDLILNNDEIILSNKLKMNCLTKKDKIKTFFSIRELIISFEPDNFEYRLKDLFKYYEINWRSKCNKMSMSWQDVEVLSKDEIVTIASHTKNHYALNRLSEADIIKEVLSANTLIESKINKKVEHFSYPFGTKNEIGSREFKLLKSMGFKTATTTRNGNIYSEHKKHMECLPRIMLTENYKIKQIGNLRREKVVTF